MKRLLPSLSLALKAVASENDMYCDMCGARIPDNAKFCRACGTALPDEPSLTTLATEIQTADKEGEQLVSIDPDQEATTQRLTATSQVGETPTIRSSTAESGRGIRSLLSLIGDVSLLILATAVVSYCFGISLGEWNIIVMTMFSLGSLVVVTSFLSGYEGFRALNIVAKGIYITVAWAALAYVLLSFATSLLLEIGNLISWLRVFLVPISK